MLLFIKHFSYLFYIKDIYMCSSDYIDAMDLGLTPIEDSQYWVANFIQVAFNNWIKSTRPDIANEIKSKTNMYLD